MSEEKNLIVYYSRTGNAEVIATSLKKELDCDCEMIIDNVNRKGIIGYIKSGYEASKKKCPPIAGLKHDIKEYNSVIIVTPIWAGTMVSPMRTFIKDNIKNIKNLSIIVTSAGDDCRIAKDLIESFKREIKTLKIIPQRKVKNGEYKIELTKFIKEMSK